MKRTIIRANGLIAALVATLLTACGGGSSGIEGEYIGVEGDSMINSITLGSGGVASVVYPLGFGKSGEGSYTVEGTKVHVTLPGASVTTLEIDAKGCLTDFFVGTYCRNGGGGGTIGSGSTSTASAGGGTERYEATTDEGRILLELLAGGTARMTMTPFGGGSDMPQRMSFDLSYQVRGNNIMIEMPGEGPTELTRSGRDLMMTSDGETARFIRQ